MKAEIIEPVNTENGPLYKIRYDNGKESTVGLLYLKLLKRRGLLKGIVAKQEQGEEL